MGVPSDNNVAAKAFEKLSKYNDLEIEVEKMCHLKTTTIPVVVGALGLIKKGTNAFIEKIPGSLPITSRSTKNSLEQHSPCVKKSSLALNLFFSISILFYAFVVRTTSPSITQGY